ncbi:MAG: FecR domain-containing protein [Bacteroidota bacterium]
MPDYTKVTELVADQHFQDWCLRPEADHPVDWQAWANAQAGGSELVTAAKAVVLELSLRPDAKATEVAYRNVRRKIAARQRANQRRTWVAYAAAAVALLLLGFTGWWLSATPPQPVYATVNTANGELRPVKLPDGSLVTLNANSSLRYDTNFLASDRREAWLDGEGFFDITSASEVNGLPFTVHTSAGDIMVVGTEFNVRQRENIFEVVLTEGRVKVEDAFKGEEVTLIPGQRAITTGSGPLRIETVETQLFTVWQSRQLLFRDMPLSRVVERLHYDYQLELRIPDKDLLQKRVSASIKDGDPFALTLALANIYQLEMGVSPDSTTITLTPR